MLGFRLESFGIIFLALLLVQRDLTVLIYAVISSKICRENPVEGRLALRNSSEMMIVTAFGPKQTRLFIF